MKMTLKSLAMMTNMSQNVIVFDYNMNEIFSGKAHLLVNDKLEFNGQFIYPNRRHIDFINTHESKNNTLIISVV